MANLTAFGGPTKSIFLNEAESHKLHLAFTVANGQTVKKGQPVKLNADGLILPCATDGSEAKAMIGYSIQNAAAGEECTIAVKGYAVIYAMSAASQNAGMVSYNGVNGTDGNYTNYATSVAANMNGWSMDKATAANQLIRVILI